MRLLVAAGIALLVVPVVAAPAAPAAAPARAAVSLQRIAFSPARVVVRPGGRVTWTWRDRFADHDLRAVGRRRFPGASAKRRGTHTVRFARRGTFRYVCTLHPGMRGTVVVR